MSGWPRLLATRDVAERVVLRHTLAGALEDYEEHERELTKFFLEQIEVRVQRGVAAAFK